MPHEQQKMKEIEDIEITLFINALNLNERMILKDILNGVLTVKEVRDDIRSLSESIQSERR